MLKSAYRAFAKECYLIIELMRQFYDEQRVYRITGESGGVEYTTFSAQQLRGVPGGVVGGVQLGDHEPVFDIVDGKMNLQLFADGNAGGSAAAGEGGAEAAPVVQEPALRPALSEAYGVDGEDVDGLIEAVKNGKVKDNAY